MIPRLIHHHLLPVAEAERRRLRLRCLGFWLLAIAFGLLVCWSLRFFNVEFARWIPVAVGGVGLLGLIISLVRLTSRRPDFRKLAGTVENSFPELDGSLYAALDQEPDESGRLHFLQQRIIHRIGDHAAEKRWPIKVFATQLKRSRQIAVVGACALIVSMLGLLLSYRSEAAVASLDTDEPAVVGDSDPLITVTPGDVEIERGSRLIVEARFWEGTPDSALLELNDREGLQRVPMQAGLDDSVFSALIPSVESDATYQVRFGDNRSEDYQVTTFTYPKLVQADAHITPPVYLKQEPRLIEDTRKISVMEGAEITWKIRVNKPLEAAELFGEDETIISLETDPSDPTLLFATHQPEVSQRYRLHLVDEASRSNKRPPWIEIKVKRNLPPDMKFTFPGRDHEISALEEFVTTGEVWDDVEVLAAGITFSHEGNEVDRVLISEPASGRDKHAVETTFAIEDLGAEERDIIAYHLWAEDRDNEGQRRRVLSDQFYAQVRLFEGIFMEGSPANSESSGEGETTELLKLQQEIVSASWKLVREFRLREALALHPEDATTVRQSQIVAIGEAGRAIEEAGDIEVRELLEEARSLMEVSAEAASVVVASEKGEGVEELYMAAFDAYSKLVEAQARETEIALSQSQSQGQPQDQEQMLLNLELEQKELKYEENSQAQDPQQTAEQAANLEVLNRLKELAKRQEAIAEKIKELENQRQSATEEEKQEIDRQLKRLREEQRELLRSVDELSQEMDSEENRANMAESREQLEEIREDVQETSEQLEAGELADAANSATRAADELEEMKEEFRERTSQQFAQEIRSIRDQARQLAEQEESIGEALDELTDRAREGDAFSPESQKARGEVAQALSGQMQELSDLVEEMKELSEQAETSEPLLSQSLYDAVRNTSVNGVMESLEDARDSTYFNRPSQARAPERAAARGIEALKEEVEAASEKLLGSESAALRMARNELDRLIEEAQGEASRARGESAESEDMGASRQPGEESEGDALAEVPTPGAGRETGEQGESSESRGESPGEGQGQPSEQASANPAEGEEAGQTSGQPGEGPNGETLAEGEGRASNEPGESGEMAQNGGKGNRPGEGQESTETPGEGQAPGEGEGQTPGEGQGQGQGTSPDGEGQLAQGQNGGRQRGSLPGGGSDGSGPLNQQSSVGGQPFFFNQQSEQRETGPLTGDDFRDWADRLGNIEEMLQQEELRNQAGQVLDEARDMRIRFQRDNLPPGAVAIEQRITSPLIELRTRISEEIAKLNRENPIAPIDRDEVPSEFRDLVRRYYEELGSGR
ncbi:MAG: hypothetical protein AAF236_01240 [Verrucomicrobiota bacterium]